jgi:hypothetical protein
LRRPFGGRAPKLTACHGCELEIEPSTKPFKQKVRRLENWSRVADAFFMDAAMLWKEMIIGFLMAGFLMVLVLVATLP